LEGHAARDRSRPAADEEVISSVYGDAGSFALQVGTRIPLAATYLLRESAGTQVDPDVVEALLSIVTAAGVTAAARPIR
jgi:hypothetical protein